MKKLKIHKKLILILKIIKMDKDGVAKVATLINSISESQAKFDNFTMLEELSSIQINPTSIQNFFSKRINSVEGEIKTMKDL